MLLDKLNSGRSVFSTDFGETKGKTIGEFSNEEWDKLLSKVDNALEAYKEDLKEREEEAKEQQKKKRKQLPYVEMLMKNLNKMSCVAVYCRACAFNV